jgi:hypothetical protein
MVRSREIRGGGEMKTGKNEKSLLLHEPNWAGEDLRSMRTPNSVRSTQGRGRTKGNLENKKHFELWAGRARDPTGKGKTEAK